MRKWNTCHFIQSTKVPSHPNGRCNLIAQNANMVSLPKFVHLFWLCANCFRDAFLSFSFFFWDFLFLFWNLFRFCCSTLFIFHDIFHLHGTYVSTLVGYLMHEQRYFANVIPCCCCCFFFCLFSFIESVVYVVFFIAVPFILQVNIFHS